MWDFPLGNFNPDKLAKKLEYNAVLEHLYNGMVDGCYIDL
jgi:hypothetical protein